MQGKDWSHQISNGPFYYPISHHLLRKRKVCFKRDLKWKSIILLAWPMRWHKVDSFKRNKSDSLSYILTPFKMSHIDIISLILTEFSLLYHFFKFVGLWRQAVIIQNPGGTKNTKNEGISSMRVMVNGELDGICDLDFFDKVDESWAYFDGRF